MTPQTIALRLIQLIALTLPAVAILLQFQLNLIDSDRITVGYDEERITEGLRNTARWLTISALNILVYLGLVLIDIPLFEKYLVVAERFGLALFVIIPLIVAFLKLVTAIHAMTEISILPDTMPPISR